jgi:aminoglycoside phosphotransferase family enzyme/predicted kinase
MAVGTAHAPVDRLGAGLGGPVELRETHAAWVLLAGDRALKVRKPVRYSFLDYSTIERRFAAGVEEVRVNEALAPGLYRGVRPLLERDGRLVLGPFGRDADAVDYAVEMRRFDERRTMAARCAAGELRDEQVDAIADLLARFHARAEPCETGGATAFLARVRADVADVAALADGATARALTRFAEAAVARRAARLDERARRGLCRDGHGDLRAEHVVLEQPPLIVDRIEFDASLRCADVGSDLAFLAMDLEALGHAAAADRLLAAYVRAGGSLPDARLLALFEWQRALVRAKVALLRDDEPAAARLLALADDLAWRERMPAVLLVLGAPGSGKSTIAAELGRRTRLPVVGSDALRKAMIGVPPAARLPSFAYRDEVTAAVYRALGHRAAHALAARSGVIVDATGRSRALRRTLIEGLRGAGPLVAVVCTAPAEVRRARVEARLRDPTRVSDADVAVAETIAAGFEPLDADLEIDRVLMLDADRPPAAALDDLAAALDGAGIPD